MKAQDNGNTRALHFHKPPQRIVSLVPSMTESLFDLGLGEAVIGITDYCCYPAEALAELPRLGGPKNPDAQKIIDLKPDLVLANWEENSRRTVEMLEAAGIPVWVTFPKTVRQAMDVLWTLVGVFQQKSAAVRLETLELSLDWAFKAAEQRGSFRYFCPIWYDRTEKGEPWWMAFNQDTYAHDLLRLFGGVNVFAERERRYPLGADLGFQESEMPGERDTRYPRLGLDEIRAANPEIILLPSEPFPFSETHRQEFYRLLADSQAARSQQIHLVDGSLITWHGTRLAKAVQELPFLFSTFDA